MHRGPWAPSPTACPPSSWGRSSTWRSTRCSHACGTRASRLGIETLLIEDPNDAACSSAALPPPCTRGRNGGGGLAGRGGSGDYLSQRRGKGGGHSGALGEGLLGFPGEQGQG